MKSQIKKLLQIILRQCAVRLLRKFNPKIIAITGSVGKTSAKDAIYAVLESDFDVRKTQGNLNTEIGVPLTIIGTNSIKKISEIFKKTFFSKEYPKNLILEMGADKVGDIKYLTSFAKPDIAVVSTVACSHLEQFCNLHGVAREKGFLVESLDKDDWAVLNYDDENVRAMAKRTSANIIFYGFKKQADIIADKIKHSKNGIDFEVSYKGKKQSFHINVIGKHQIYSALSAIACGIIYGMELKKIAIALENYKLPANRTNVLSGIKNTIIINDTYNANPESTRAALETLSDISKELSKKARRVFAFGDMLELGPTSVDLHLGLKKEIKEVANVLVLVGEKTKNIYEKLKKDYSENIFWFEDSEKAAAEISQIIGNSDIILVKGSRGMKMEKIVNVLKL